MNIKNIKIISIIFQSIGIGGVFLYIYSFYTYKNKYEIIPQEIKSNMNLYLIIGIAGLIIYVITKILIFIKQRKEHFEPANVYEQMNEDSTKIYNPIQQEVKENLSIEQLVQAPKIEKTNIAEEKEEEKITSKAEEIPFERRMTCPNCLSTVDKEAFMCLNCGYLLQKNEYKNAKLSYGDKKTSKFDLYYKILNNLFLIVLIIVVGFFAYDLAKNRGLIENTTEIESEKMLEFYSLSYDIISYSQERINNNLIKINHNEVYFELKDLGYENKKYDSEKSYIAYNSKNKSIYIALQGKNEYSEYSIDITEIKNLDLSKVLINTGIISPIDNKLLIDENGKVTVYNKN